MISFDCKHCEALLFDFHEDKLPAEQATRVDEHLQSCDSCSALLSDIWQMSLLSSSWKDQPAPRWNRSDYLADRGGWRLPELLATAASVLALVLVLTDTHISSSEDGLTLKVGRDSYVTGRQLEEFQAAQVSNIDSRFQRLTSQQAASNQLLLRSVLETSRKERREDFTTLVSYLDAADAYRTRQTQEELRYLMASQAEDEKDIQQLSDAFARISARRGNDM